MGYIYMTTNLINGRKYIGKCNRNRSSRSYIGSGKALRLAIEKYGKENFKKEILEYADNTEDLNRLEKEYIEKFNATESPEFYNMMEGGQGGATTTGMEPWNKGKTTPEDVKSKISDGLRGLQNNAKKIQCYNEEETLTFDKRLDAYDYFKKYKDYKLSFASFTTKINKGIKNNEEVYNYYWRNLK